MSEIDYEKVNAQKSSIEEEVYNNLYEFINQGRVDYILNNLNSFGLKHSDIAYRLIDLGLGGTVANVLEKFVGLDYNVIAHKLIDSDEGYSVIRNLEKFEGVSHSEIAHKLIDSGQGLAVIRKLEKFVGLDYNVIAHKLIDSGEGYSVAKHLDQFMQLDYNVIAHKLIEAGMGYAVAKYLTQFDNLDKQVAHRLIDQQRGYVVADNLTRFVRLDSHIAYKLIDMGYIYAVVAHLEKFNDVDAVAIVRVKDKIIENLDKNLITFLLNGWYFESIKKLIELIGTEEFKSLYRNIIETYLKKIVNDLIKEKNKVLLQNVVRITELLGIVMDIVVQQKIEMLIDTAAVDKQENIEYGQINLTDELIEFYINEFILAEINNLEGSNINILRVGDRLQREDQEFAFRDKVSLWDIKRTIAEHVDHIFDWLKKYLVVAISSELRHFPHSPQEVKLDIDTKQVTTEEVRIYIHRAIDMFYTTVWDDDYGGDVWALLAKSAYTMWQDDVTLPQKIVLIDHIVDLQHHTGHIFDKDKKNRISESKLEYILESKKHNQGDIEDTLTLLGKATTNRAMLKRLHERVRFLKHVQKTSTKALGSD